MNIHTKTAVELRNLRDRVASWRDRGNDIQAIIRWAAKSKAEKDSQNIPRVLFTSEDLPNDLVFFKCKILHICGSIEKAQLKLNCMVNSATNGSVHQQVNPGPPNLFLAPNEHDLNSVVVHLTRMNSSGFPHPVGGVAISVSQSQLQPSTVISLSPQFSNSDYIPQKVVNNEEIIFDNYSYAATDPENFNQIDSDVTPRDISIIQLLKQQLSADISNMLTRPINLENAVANMERKLDNYGTRNLDLAKQVQNLTRVVKKTKNVPIYLF
ncbi:hypothetical protein QAD02_011239 [Eretmocerus hayati]|uniref:Uncharacterized protein n=1 Tax=Eretmocerus hayati TaxID=131215 RepID=A0ACC2NX62_9HYME|nr:hypothetical protein QAD02_011239 [Eretmocerus hayati]